MYQNHWYLTVTRYIFRKCWTLNSSFATLRSPGHREKHFNITRRMPKFSIKTKNFRGKFILVEIYFSGWFSSKKSKMSGKSIFRETWKIIIFYNWIPIVKFRIFRFSKIFEDFFSTKINFPRKIFFFIENFCIRRVIRNCFSLCPGDLKVPKLLFVANTFLKMWRVIVNFNT